MEGCAASATSDDEADDEPHRETSHGIDRDRRPPRDLGDRQTEPEHCPARERTQRPAERYSGDKTESVTHHDGRRESTQE